MLKLGRAPIGLSLVGEKGSEGNDEYNRVDVTVVGGGKRGIEGRGAWKLTNTMYVCISRPKSLTSAPASASSCLSKPYRFLG